MNPALGFGALATVQPTIQGLQVMYSLRQAQIEGMFKGDATDQNRVINSLFGLAASRELTTFFSHSYEFCNLSVMASP
jgi:hypothetical protein